MKNQKSEYSKKLLDPRWQKKRLEILERDNWSCYRCGDDQATLHVHHRVYMRDCEPWDIPSEYLVTLCETCHQVETENVATEVALLGRAVKTKFLTSDISVLACAFYELKMVHGAEVIASALAYLMINEDRMREFLDKYFEHLANEAKNREKVDPDSLPF